MGRRNPPPPHLPIPGLSHPAPGAPAKEKSRFLIDDLFRRPSNEVDGLYLALRRGFDPSGRICTLRMAAFVSIYDHADGVLKILSRSVNPIPPDANLRLWVEIDQSRPLTARGRAEEYVRLAERVLHTYFFNEAVLDRVLTINRHFYDREANLSPGNLIAGRILHTIVRWGIRGRKERHEIGLLLRL